MSISVLIEAPKGAAKASAAIPKGRFVVKSANGTRVAQAGAAAAALGVTADAAAADGDGVKLYLPGQIAKVQTSSVLAAGNGGQVNLGVDANGLARAAVAGDAIVAVWLPGEGEAAAANDFISVYLLAGTSAAS